MTEPIPEAGRDSSLLITTTWCYLKIIIEEYHKLWRSLWKKVHKRRSCLRGKSDIVLGEGNVTKTFLEEATSELGPEEKVRVKKTNRWSEYGVQVRPVHPEEQHLQKPRGRVLAEATRAPALGGGCRGGRQPLCMSMVLIHAPLFKRNVVKPRVPGGCTVRCVWKCNWSPEMSSITFQPFGHVDWAPATGQALLQVWSIRAPSSRSVSTAGEERTLWKLTLKLLYQHRAWAGGQALCWVLYWRVWIIF